MDRRGQSFVSSVSVTAPRTTPESQFQCWHCFAVLSYAQVQCFDTLASVKQLLLMILFELPQLFQLRVDGEGYFGG